MVNLTEKRRNLARKLVAQGPAFMDVVYALEALNKQKVKGGTTATPLVFEEADFDGISGLQHIDVAKVNAAFTVIGQISSALVSNKFDEVLEALRP